MGSRYTGTVIVCVGPMISICIIVAYRTKILNFTIPKLGILRDTMLLAPSLTASNRGVHADPICQ